MQRLVAWFKTQSTLTRAELAIVFVFANATRFAGCAQLTPVQSAKAHAAAVDFCKARAAYKALAVATGGALDPLPDSPRAKLEAAEDVFCAGVK